LTHQMGGGAGVPSYSEWQIWTMHVDEAEPVLVAEGASDTIEGAWGFDVSGDLIVYIDTDLNVVAVDASTSERITISGERNPKAGTVRAVVTDGRYIFWRESGSYAGYDLHTRLRFNSQHLGDGARPQHLRRHSDLG